jgi:hydrogenase expression/formation protein HypC
MCLALPGKVFAVNACTPPMADVDFSGVKKSVCIAFTPEVQIGDYVIVHVGFAIAILNEEAAKRTLELL